MLRTNPALFELFALNPDKFIRFASDLEDAVPAIVALIQEDRYNPKDFAGPEALERTIEKAARAEEARQVQVKLVQELNNAGFDAELLIAAVHYGFWDRGNYCFGNKTITADTFRKNFQRFAKSGDQITKAAENLLRKMAGGGLILEHRKGSSYSLSPSVSGSSQQAKALASLLAWIKANPPTNERGVVVPKG